mmetsp:Transcript_1507/g.1430  ORF Transcript_1507/g.1430 Transcript_1507/m.1430 type:complete len:203 (+) Transcript_1507:616-1224(+)
MQMPRIPWLYYKDSYPRDSRSATATRPAGEKPPSLRSPNASGHKHGGTRSPRCSHCQQTVPVLHQSGLLRALGQAHPAVFLRRGAEQQGSLDLHCHHNPVHPTPQRQGRLVCLLYRGVLQGCLESRLHAVASQHPQVPPMLSMLHPGHHRRFAGATPEKTVVYGAIGGGIFDAPALLNRGCLLGHLPPRSLGMPHHQHLVVH